MSQMILVARVLSAQILPLHLKVSSSSYRKQWRVTRYDDHYVRGTARKCTKYVAMTSRGPRNHQHQQKVYVLPVHLGLLLDSTS